MALTPGQRRARRMWRARAIAWEDGMNGATSSPAAALLADYDDGLAIDWLTGGLANKQSGVLTYDDTIAAFPSATVTGSIDPGANDYVTVDALNYVVIALSGLTFTQGRGTLVNRMKGGFASNNPFWISTSSTLDLDNSIALNTFSTNPRLRISQAAGVTGSAIPAADVSSSAVEHKIGSTWLNATGCRCTVDGSTTALDSSLSFSWTQSHLGFGGSASEARLVTTLFVPTYQSQAELAALTA